MVSILAICIYAYYQFQMNPYRKTAETFEVSESLDRLLSEEEVLSDLSYFMDCLRSRHPAWLDNSGKDKAAEVKYEKMAKSIDAPMTVLELYQMTSEIAAVLHDGHTNVGWYNEEESRYINDFTPLQTYGKPVTINGISAEEIFERFKNIYSYETEEYAELKFYSSAIISEAYMKLCGIDTSAGIDMCFNDGHAQIEKHFDFVRLDEADGYASGDTNNRYVYYEIDEENNVGIFSLISCQYTKTYSDTLYRFFQEVYEKNIGNVIVDLRGNGGGNSYVTNEFIQYLNVASYKSWDNAVRYGWYLHKNENNVLKNKALGWGFSGNVYVLTDIETYSAAMDFAMLIQDNHLGTIVGQPSGNLPDGYGDMLSFQMPNSRLIVNVSYKKWYRIDRSKAGEPVMPDVAVDSNKALEKVYELIAD